MSFLDNSGDIILDAVLTDKGRKDQATGEFNVVKFALCDDEIDYSLYRNANHDLLAHASGSAYYDLQILQTPILESFTESASGFKSHIISLGDHSRLYMPVLRLNTKQPDRQMVATTGSFHIAATKATRDVYDGVNGVVDGQSGKGVSHIRVDQGLDTIDLTPDSGMDPENRETRYSIQLDNRFGVLTDFNGRTVAVNFIDDDDIATYTLTLGPTLSGPRGSGDRGLVTLNNERDPDPMNQVVDGPRGTIVRFKLKSTLALRNSTTHFTRLGSTAAFVDAAGTSRDVYTLQSNVRITGLTTGARIDIPITYFKKTDE